MSRVAVQQVVNALHEEADSFRDPWNRDVETGIVRALRGVADRLAPHGLDKPAPGAPDPPTAPSVSPQGHDPAQTDAVWTRTARMAAGEALDAMVRGYASCIELNCPHEWCHIVRRLREIADGVQSS